jgi:hypothetical protein
MGRRALYCTFTVLEELVRDLPRLGIKSVNIRQIAAREMLVVEYGADGVATLNVTKIDAERLNVYVQKLRECV